MSSQADQFAAELTGSGSLADKEYARLLSATGQPAGKFSLRDLYNIANEVPRLPQGRYASVWPPGNTSFADGFARADGPLGSNWVILSGSTANINISAGQVVTSAGASGNVAFMRWVQPHNSSNHYAQIDCYQNPTTFTDEYIGIRMNAAGTEGFFARRVTSIDQIRFYKMVNGVLSYSMSWSSPISVFPYTLKIEAFGPTIIGSVNGTTLFTIHDTDFANNRYVGIRSDYAGNIFDNFSSAYSTATDAITIQQSFGLHPSVAAQPASGQPPQDAIIYDNKLFFGYGDWTNNTGPIDVTYLDLVTLSWGIALSATPTEALERFKIINGSLFTPWIDPHPPMVDNGYSTNRGGTWHNVSDKLADAMHAFDIESFTGNPDSDLFLAGAGTISGSQHGLIYRSTDGGVTWGISYDQGLDANGTINSLSKYGSLLYAIGSTGKYTWNGSAWSVYTGPWSLGNGKTYRAGGLLLNASGWFDGTNSGTYTGLPNGATLNAVDVDSNGQLWAIQNRIIYSGKIVGNSITWTREASIPNNVSSSILRVDAVNNRMFLLSGQYGIWSADLPALPPPTYNDVVIADTPLMYLAMDEGTGLPADSSGNAANPTLGSGTLTWVTDPQHGSVLDVSAGSLKLVTRVPQSGYAYEIWLKATGPTAANDTVMSDWGGAAGSNGTMFYFYGAGVTRYYHGANNIFGPNITDSLWHHLVYQWNGTTMEIYFDGVQYNSANIATAPGLGDNPYISSYGNVATGRFFPGQVKRAAIYNHALSASSIQNHYNTGK